MSISFSGLASGLDTSSWITQLTALKRAKVTSFQQQREAVLTSKDALTKIKSFFQTFRTMLEKVTDARFNADIGNIFTQNVAVSTNNNVLTATARSDADLGVYNIQVHQLATNTQAVSKYSYTTTIENTTDAKCDTLLKDIGVSSGNILVTKLGVESTINIADDDTVGSFVNKLRAIGVNAEFSEITSTFTMDINMIDIDDFSGTGIVNALNSQAVNKGYASSSNLSRPLVETIYTPANGNTVLSELGVSAGDLSVTNTDGLTKTVNISASDTIDNLISKLADPDVGVTAVIEDGVFTIHNAVINTAGTTSNIVEKMNLSNAGADNNTVFASKTQTSRALTYNSTITQTTSATGTTRLSVYGVNAGTFTISNSDSTYTITLGANDDIDTLISKLDAKGIHASIDRDGIFKIDDANITDAGATDIINKLGLEAAISDHTQVSNTLSYQMTVTNTINATGSTTLRDLGVQAGTVTIVSDETTYTFAITNTTTMQNFIDELNAKHINASIDDGHFKISNANIVGESTTNLKAALKITSPSVASNTQKSGVLMHTTIVTEISTATEMTRLNDLPGVTVTDGQTVKYVTSHGYYRTITLGTESTIDTIISHFRDNGVSVDRRANGSLYIVGATITAGGTFDIITHLKLTSVVGDSGSLSYSGSALNVISTHEENDDVTNDILLSDFGITSGKYTIVSNGQNYTAEISVGDTFGSFRDSLRAYGIQAGLVSVGEHQMQLIVTGSGDSYVKNYVGAGASNIVNTFFSSPKVTTYDYESDLYLTNTSTFTIPASNDTLLETIGITSGQYFIYQNGEKHVANISTSDTFADLKSTLLGYGLQASLVRSGEDVRLVINGNGDSYIAASSSSSASNIVSTFFTTPKSTNYDYQAKLEIKTDQTVTIHANNDTLMSDYFDVHPGQYYIYSNGVKNVVNISAEETFGDFRETLRTFGLQTGLVKGADDKIRLVITGNGDSYVAASSAVGASDVVAKLGLTTVSTYDYAGYNQTSTVVTNNVIATLDTKLSDYDQGVNHCLGKVSISYDGNLYAINISADDTFGTLIGKLEKIGINAQLSDSGRLTLLTGEKSFSINDAGTTSKIVSNLGLTYNDNYGNYIASSSPVKSTTTTVEDRTVSATNYADSATQLNLLNISGGSISVYRNGQRFEVMVNPYSTFGGLETAINDKLRAAGVIGAGETDIKIDFEDGYMKIHSLTAGVSVDVGSSVDSSNFSTICGLAKDGSGSVTSSRELYKVNADSVITNSGLFRKGQVTTGLFTIGQEVFSIDNSTTIAELISQINSSALSNATAFWDSVEGRLVVRSRSSGSTYVNIEAGSAAHPEAAASNFTDIMGFTNSTWDGGTGSLTSTRLDSSSQEIGKSALFSINGTNFSSTSNTVGSDVSRINGVTINLKNVSEEGETITLTVEGDKESAANVIADVVDTYNELIDNIDKELAKDGLLKDQSVLKTLRNRIRNMMTSSLGGGLPFSNLLTVGISTDAASSGNISVEGIDRLTFDKEKFMDAYKADRVSLQRLLVGTDDAKGIFRNVGIEVSNALSSSHGFFSVAEASYNKKVESIDTKIKRATSEADRYQSILESKFKTMDLMIAKIQQQYQTFLGG